MKWITSTDLNNWAPARDCQENMPLLIRKLLRAEGNNIVQLFFPAGDNIVFSGWDGTLKSSNLTEYIPNGFSVWEIGCRKDFKAKAEEDYKTRTAKPKDVDPSITTFVFVTPYMWSTKDEWIKEKMGEGIWSDIRVYDGQVLEHWIELHTAVGAWLSKYLEKYPDVLPLDDFWDSWHKSPTHTIPSAMVLAGRQEATDKFINFLNAPASSIIIKASTQEEVIAFAAASINNATPLIQEDLFARTLIVESESYFRQVVVQKRPLILITKFEDSGAVNQAVRKNHHVLIASDYTSSANDAIILPRLRREGFEKGLQEMGFGCEEAGALSRDCAQSLSVLRRRLQFVQNQQPEWAKENNHLDIIPALLAGSWNEEKDGDKQIIADLSGMNYDDYISKLSRWKLHKDAPVLQIGISWKITSALDSLSILSPFIIKKNFERLQDVALMVLNEVHPAFDLKPETRYMSSLYGKNSTYSPELKSGICQTLVLIAVFGDSFNITGISLPQQFVNSVIQPILRDADGKKLSSLHYHLPSIAEAAPDTFLNEIERALESNASSITEMFEETTGIFSPNSYHTGLLWALENLVASEEYLLRVTLILGKLAQLDPGGRLSNRPINSLREIYIPWIGQIDLPINNRKSALSKLAKDQPAIAWSLFLKLLPSGHDVAHPLHKCNWRYNISIVYLPTNAEIIDFYSFVFDWLLTLSKAEPERIITLVSNIENLIFSDRSKLLVKLKAIHKNMKGQSEEIADKLRHILSHHRAYPDTHWSLHEEELKGIEEVYELYKPTDLNKKYLYLFKDNSIDIPEGINKAELSYDERELLIEEMRSTALDEVYQTSGLSGILQMVALVNNSWSIGRTIAKLALTNDEEEIILHFFESDNKNELLFVRSFTIFKINKYGNDWISQTWLKIQSFGFDDRAIANFFLSLPQNQAVWILLNQTTDSIQNLYWKEIDIWFSQSNLEEKLFVIGKLQAANRHIIIVDRVSYYAEGMPSETLLDILHKAATIKSDENVRADHHHIEILFKSLQARSDFDKSRLANLEWLYIDILTDIYSLYKPANLQEELAKNPSFFVELISYMCKPDSKEEIEEILTEEQTALRYRLANVSRNLLNCWSNIPGVKSDNFIDGLMLKNWISEAREKAKKANRLTRADYEIGKLLGKFPKNNIAWPPDEICEILDTVGTHEILSCFRTEIRNSRGVYSKAIYEGGQQERNLADFFEKMSKIISLKWPKTASILKCLSIEYIADAKRADESAQIDELRF